MTCSGPECQRPVARSGLCWGHYRQRQRGHRLRPLEPRDLAPIHSLTAAALAYAQADDEDYDRALARLKTAARRYRRRDPDDADRA